MSRSTPWGPAQDVRMIAPGITSYSTAGHGGINISTARLAEMPEQLRSVAPFAGPGWYEEDCDWAIVALAFPLYFTADHLAAAVRTLGPVREGDHYLNPARAWLASEAGAAVRGIAEQWAQRNAGLYRMACCGSIPRRHEALAAKFEPTDPFSRRHLSWVFMYRLSDEAEAEALLFSDEQAEPIDLSKIPAERVIRCPA